MVPGLKTLVASHFLLLAQPGVEIRIYTYVDHSLLFCGFRRFIRRLDSDFCDILNHSEKVRGGFEVR